MGKKHKHKKNKKNKKHGKHEKHFKKEKGHVFVASSTGHVAPVSYAPVGVGTYPPGYTSTQYGSPQIPVITQTTVPSSLQGVYVAPVTGQPGAYPPGTYPPVTYPPGQYPSQPGVYPPVAYPGKY